MSVLPTLTTVILMHYAQTQLDHLLVHVKRDMLEMGDLVQVNTQHKLWLNLFNLFILNYKFMDLNI